MDAPFCLSMTAPLRQTLLCPPESAGWSDPGRAGRWRELGYARPPDARAAMAEHEGLRGLLEGFGVEIVELEASEELGCDAVYTHDASLPGPEGLVLLRMGKGSRAAEPTAHGAAYERLGVPVMGRLGGNASAEGGDLLWLDERTLLAGRGYRTNAAGIAQLRTILGPSGVEVIEAPLPHGEGPAICLHLMSLISLLDERTALVDLPWLSVSTVQLLRERGVRLVPIVAEERDSFACNVLALGEGRLIALAENERTNDRLRGEGFEVATFPGRELAGNGGGGPTCLTRPLRRERVSPLLPEAP